jgi:hypothetical protein
MGPGIGDPILGTRDPEDICRTPRAEDRIPNLRPDTRDPIPEIG